MIDQRRNPGHWIWSADLPHRFEPSEMAYLEFRQHAPETFTQVVEDLITEGLSAEQMVCLWEFDRTLPAYAVVVIGAALAFWVQRAQEER